MRIKKTERGFALAEFVDRYGAKCSLQKSSLATEDCIWLGVNEIEGKPARMHLTRKLAKQLMPHLEKFIETGEL